MPKQSDNANEAEQKQNKDENGQQEQDTKLHNEAEQEQNGKVNKTNTQNVKPIT